MRLIASLFLLILAACESTPAYTHSTYTLPTTPGGRLCVKQCREAQGYCSQSCDLDFRACYNDMQAQALKNYDRYARERFNGNLPLDMRPSDFEHPESCNNDKKRCLADCDRPYNACYTSCGGEVVTQSSCQFLCFE